MPFVDESRPEVSTVDDTDKRTLPSVVWYPAGEVARDGPKSTYADYFTPALRTALSALAPPGFLDTASDSVRDAPVADDGPFPLIVFSHGNGGLGVQSFFLTEYLASHGYIVVCPDHTGNALLTELPSGHTVSNASTEANYASLTGPKMYISITDAGHFSFSNGCPLGIGAGDGCGAGTRADGSSFTYLEDTRVHEITKHYQTALWGLYLKGITAYGDDLLAEPFAADVTIEREGMP